MILTRQLLRRRTLHRVPFHARHVLVPACSFRRREVIVTVLDLRDQYGCGVNWLGYSVRFGECRLTLLSASLHSPADAEFS